MTALMPLLDAARGHEGEYDDTSYELARAVHEWINSQWDGDWRQARLETAAERGCIRAYTNPDGTVERRQYPPGALGVIAELLSP